MGPLLWAAPAVLLLEPHCRMAGGCCVYVGVGLRSVGKGAGAKGCRCVRVCVCVGGGAWGAAVVGRFCEGRPNNADVVGRCC